MFRRYIDRSIMHGKILCTKPIMDLVAKECICIPLCNERGGEVGYWYTAGPELNLLESCYFARERAN